MELKLAAVLLAVAVTSGCAASNTNPDKGNSNTESSLSGQLNLYVSDQPAAIDGFDHLNVTVSKVRVFKSSGEVNQSEDSVNTTNRTNSGFQEFNVSRTVDLTKLKGENATSILEADLETGNYSKMELEASNVDAEIDGSSVNVKLPSEKLQLTKGFTVKPNRTTEFVFDIQVVQRGNQGYILRPVISKSGTVGEDVGINRKGKSSGPEQGSERSAESGNRSSEGPSKKLPV